MSRQRPAIEIALDLKAMPSLVKLVRARPLPPDVAPILRIAAGADEILEEFSKKYGLSQTYIRDACIFFLQEAVLFSGADSFRTLGLAPDAASDEIKEHKRWLLMWLHPDRNDNRWEAALFQRVVRAAKEVAEPRARASAAQPPAKPPKLRALTRRRKFRPRYAAKKPQQQRPRLTKTMKFAMLLLLLTGILFVPMVFMGALAPVARPWLALWNWGASWL